MDKKAFIENLRNSFKIIFKNYRILFVGIAAELSFLLLFNTLYITFRNGIGNNLINLGDDIVAGADTNSIGKVLTSNYGSNVLILGAVLVAISYLLYCFFQGFIWKFSFNLESKKGQYILYIKKFFLVNLFWLPIFGFYLLSDFIVSFFLIVVDRSGFVSYLIDILRIVILSLIIYFAFISYVMVNKMKVMESLKVSFTLGLKSFTWIVSMYMVILAGIVLLNLLLLPLNVHYYLIILIGAVIVIPAMIWARLFIKLIVENLLSEHKQFRIEKHNDSKK